MISHALKQPFILATGVAAFIHSSWSLATYFGGHPPIYPGSVSIGYLASLAYWLIPAMLIAFAIDLGMVSTSSQIRAGHRTWSKFMTFFVLALATYILQLTYIMAHMPEVPLAEGVRQTWLPLASLIRDASLFVIPSFLPLATWLYTVDHQKDDQKVVEASLTLPEHQKSVILPALTEIDGISGNPDDGFTAKCPDCNWSAPYASHYQAKQALASHKKVHTKQVKLLEPLHSNGNHSLEEGLSHE